MTSVSAMSIPQPQLHATLHSHRSSLALPQTLHAVDVQSRKEKSLCS